MMVVSVEMIIINALAAKQAAKLNYDEIREFSKILFKKLNDSGICYMTEEQYERVDYIDYCGIRFMKGIDCARLMTNATEEDINDLVIRMYYNEKVVNIFKESRKEYAEKDLSQKEDVHSRKK